MSEETKIEFCSSCGSKEIEVTGKKYYCPVCDVTYTVTKEGTKPTDTNPLGKTNDRLDKVEGAVKDLQNKPAVVDLQPADQQNQEIPSDDDEEPQGFIRVE